jgi:ABC-type multidrug transport system ATPase subunit
MVMGLGSFGCITVSGKLNSANRFHHFMILQADTLCFSYPQGALFTNLSLRIPAGLSWVRGGDGRGKTTLLRLLAGEVALESGDLQINGVHLHTAPALYRQQVVWVDARSTAFDQVTAKDYFASVRGNYRGWDAAALQALTEGLSLTEHLHKPMYMLSTGSKRKVWLAAALASGAAVLLLDDPFAALDKPSIAFVVQQLRRMAQQQAQACVVAHYAQLADAQGALPLAATIDLGD